MCAVPHVCKISDISLFTGLNSGACQALAVSEYRARRILSAICPKEPTLQPLHIPYSFTFTFLEGESENSFQGLETFVSEDWLKAGLKPLAFCGLSRGDKIFFGHVCVSRDATDVFVFRETDVSKYSAFSFPILSPSFSILICP